MAEQAEFMLQRGTIVVPSWAGCGVQFNQHVYAPNTGLREERFADLERKLGVLAPQFVRIFYYDAAEGVSSAGSRHTAEQKPYWDSVVRTVKLADQVAATVNITWQSGVNFFPTAQGRERAMSRFADVLETLVTTAGVTKLDWVTIQNEPNTNPPIDKKTGKRPPKVVTVDRLADIYRKLHQKLEAKGLREQIHLMGGDLLEGGKEFDEVTHGKKVTLRPNPLHHKLWFTYMSDNYADILDAYSAHMYWDYQDTKRLNSRLNDTWDIVQGLKHRRPLYITEYGVRSATRDQPVHGKIPIDPGNFKDGTPIGQTNIAAFQQAWFQIRAAQKGYAGVIKFDGHFGKGPHKPEIQTGCRRHGRAARCGQRMGTLPDVFPPPAVHDDHRERLACTRSQAERFFAAQQAARCLRGRPRRADHNRPRQPRRKQEQSRPGKGHLHRW